MKFLRKWTEGRFEEVLEHYSLYPLFDEVLISSRHGIIKPEPEIFHKMLSILKIKGNESVFVDDGLPNVEGAVKTGLNSILYTDNETFIKDLATLKVKI